MANEEMKFKVGSVFVLVKYMEAASATIGGSLNASQEHKFLSSLITVSLGKIAPLCAHSLCGASLFQQT